MHPSLTKSRFRLWLSLFLLLLIVLSALLVYQALSQMKWEVFRQHQILAEELASRIDSQLSRLIENEEQRSFAEYTFLNVFGDEKSNFIQRSPLSSYPVEADIPGVVGYFQVDDKGRFSTPLLPVGSSADAYGIAQNEREQRRQLQQQIRQILSRNQLIKTSRRVRASNNKQEAAEADRAMALSEAEEVAFSDRRDEEVSQQKFDLLEQPIEAERRKSSQLTSKLGRVAELKLESQFQAQQAPPANTVPSAIVAKKKRVSRKEQIVLAESLAVASDTDDAVRVTTFESEVDPFHFSELDGRHFVLFRKVWREGARYTQGILFEQELFLKGVIERLFRKTALSEMSDLLVAFQGDLLSHFSGGDGVAYTRAAELKGELLYRTRLSAPLAEIELIFSIKHLPAGPGSTVVYWVSSLLILVLCGGFYFIYRLGLKQLLLAQQQQDFVSAVSHELKTPLTSIRMYGEILREGWADEAKKRTYYDYIFHESERLTRLINNVLQLARVTRNEHHLNIREVEISELMDIIQSKVTSLVEHSGFTLQLNCEGVCDGRLTIDPDAFTQIILNLVDNAVKFSAKAEIKRIDIGCHCLSNGRVEFSVRDYGPGIAKGQMKKIFQLFYRSENELTRNTIGTGIGLSLVKQLVQQMGAKMDVVKQTPGVEFKLIFVR